MSKVQLEKLAEVRQAIGRLIFDLRNANSYIDDIGRLADTVEGKYIENELRLLETLRWTHNAYVNAAINNYYASDFPEYANANVVDDLIIKCLNGAHHEEEE